MKYIDFAQQFNKFPIIDVSDVKTTFSDFNSRRFYEWQKAGYIKKAAKNFYMFSDASLEEEDACFLANKLRDPSYLSLEYALGRYSLIPEMVFLYTSVSTKKTAVFHSPVGNFDYRSLREDLFFGYTTKTGKRYSYKIAEPEKAILDFLYFRADIKTADDIEELRINADEYKGIIDERKLDKYLTAFHSPSLERKIALLRRYIQEQP